jgi:NitT/TauT family transport system ATP-binding protein
VFVAAQAVDMTFPGSVRALANVDFALRSGEFASLVGPSGCGKSTLLRLIAGLASPTQGVLSVAGFPPTIARRSAVRLSFVFQDATLLPWRSAATNVGLPLELAGVARPERPSRVRDGLRMVGLSDFARRRPRELSGGMRMRVSLARALVTHPELLLLDEPFGALDDITRQKLNEDLLELWMRHRWTALFVTHNIAEAAYLSTRILVMSARPGTITADLAVPFAMPRPPELRAQPEFARFVGDVGRELRKART